LSDIPIIPSASAPTSGGSIRAQQCQVPSALYPVTIIMTAPRRKAGMGFHSVIRITCLHAQCPSLPVDPDSRRREALHFLHTNQSLITIFHIAGKKFNTFRIFHRVFRKCRPFCVSTAIDPIRRNGSKHIGKIRYIIRAVAMLTRGHCPRNVARDS
jgi:hypothetical protein